MVCGTEGLNGPLLLLDRTTSMRLGYFSLLSLVWRTFSSSVCLIPNSASYCTACRAVTGQIGPAQQSKYLVRCSFVNYQGYLNESVTMGKIGRLTARPITERERYSDQMNQWVHTVT